MERKQRIEASPGQVGAGVQAGLRVADCWRVVGL